MKRLLIWGACLASAVASGAPAVLTLTGDWQIKVEKDGLASEVTVEGPQRCEVAAEMIAKLPLYNPKAAPYATRGYKLAAVRAQECSVRFALDPDSLIVKGGDGRTFARGKDYETEPTWGCVGRLEGGAIGETTPVVARYTYGTMRLDSVVLTADGKIALRKGVPHLSLPVPPTLVSGETRLANVWVTPRLAKLDDAHLFPILETAYPELSKTSPTPAEKFIPKTLAKLNEGGKVHVLVWGDSVTVGTFVPDPAVNRWQEQFVRRLRARYPKAEITLTTEAWGGRSSGSYLGEPPGSVHNFKEKVLDLKPDLIVSEFVNDAGLNEAGVNQRYGRIRDEFKSIGAEWIILTPHYVRPDWMELAAEKNIDSDPRPYVQALRKFAAENNLALAEGSLRFGRLWRQGIPYTTLLMNNINHPNAFGMSQFADALMALFP